MIWEKIRRFLLIWACILVGLVLISVVVYWKDLSAAISGSFSATLSSYLSIALIIGVFVLLIRGIFR